MFKSWWSRFRKAVLTFRKTKLGIAMIELAFTLPPVLAMILFCIELVRIKLAQVALDTMCHACYFNFIKRGHMKDFPAIVERYRPKFLPTDSIQAWARGYSSLEHMCSQAPYGGEGVMFSREATGVKNGGRGSAVGDILNDEGASYMYPVNNDVALQPDAINASGTVFVLTFVCNYPFSNSFTRMLFHGGVNTIPRGGGFDGSGKASTFLLWSRATGIIDLSESNI